MAGHWAIVVDTGDVAWDYGGEPAKNNQRLTPTLNKHGIGYMLVSTKILLVKYVLSKIQNFIKLLMSIVFSPVNILNYEF